MTLDLHLKHFLSGYAHLTLHALLIILSTFTQDRRAGREAGRVNGDTSQVGSIETKATETGGSDQENVTSTNEEPRHQESEEQNL